MTDNDDRRRDTDYEPEEEPTTDPGAEPPKRTVQDILADYRASRSAPPPVDDKLEGGEEEEDDVPGSPAGRRAALRSAGISSSLLDIEEKQQRAMHEAVKFRPPSEDDDAE